MPTAKPPRSFTVCLTNSNGPPVREIRRRFEESLRSAEDSLIRIRLAGGPVHTVFARTIEYLLRSHGVMATEGLHPLIKAIHPDLCDDSVDRVIDGKRFGKKWKHAVRTAQQQLKKRGVICYENGLWRTCLSGQDPAATLAMEAVSAKDVTARGFAAPQGHRVCFRTYRVAGSSSKGVITASSIPMISPGATGSASAPSRRPLPQCIAEDVSARAGLWTRRTSGPWSCPVASRNGPRSRFPATIGDRPETIFSNRPLW